MYRKLLFSACSIAALLVGSKLLGTQVIPGKEVRFEWSSLDDRGRHGYRFRTDSGDLECWVRVRIDELDRAVPVEAKLGNGQPLAIAHRQEAATRWLDIFKPNAAGDKAKFIWPSGVPVEVSWEGPSLASTGVQDWNIYLKGEPFDSASRAKWRLVLNWAIGLLLVLAVIPPVYELWAGPPPKPPMSAEACILNLIEQVTGSDRAHTKRLRQFLQLVLIKKLPVKDALKSLGLDLRKSETKQLFFMASGQFRARYKALQDGINEYSDLIRWNDVET